MNGNEMYAAQQYASQQNALGGPARSENTHEKASREWSGAKTRLQEAQDSHGRASAELQAAQAAEEQAWTALQDSAGRGLPSPILSKFPLPGGFIPGPGLR